MTAYLQLSNTSLDFDWVIFEMSSEIFDWNLDMGGLSSELQEHPS